MKTEMLSLVCATLGRYTELDRLINSLERQSLQNFELIVVDQNSDDLIKPLMSVGRKFQVTHIRSSVLGNTHARNVGLSAAKGKWVAFPDDDCWYGDSFIGDLFASMDRYPDADGFFTNWSDPNSQREMFTFSEGQMTLADGFSLVSCICLFLRREQVTGVGGFNEKMGFGEKTIVKAGEEQDLVLKMISRSMKLIKLPQLNVHHSIGERVWNEGFLERIKGQGACDYFFARKYKGPFAALKLSGVWTLGYLFNIMRGNRRNAQWYSKKLEGMSLSASIE
jgi:glycosyltransferase involved in cell wall biosynthesis